MLMGGDSRIDARGNAPVGLRRHSERPWDRRADKGLARRESVRKLSPEVQDLREHAGFAALGDTRLVNGGILDLAG